MALGMKEYAVKKAREQVEKLGKEKVWELYQALYAGISSIKCGKVHPDSALKTATATLFFEKSLKK
jgi:hypothetical protein